MKRPVFIRRERPKRVPRGVQSCWSCCYFDENEPYYEPGFGTCFRQARGVEKPATGWCGEWVRHLTEHDDPPMRDWKPGDPVDPQRGPL